MNTRLLGSDVRRDVVTGQNGGQFDTLRLLAHGLRYEELEGVVGQDARVVVDLVHGERDGSGDDLARLLVEHVPGTVLRPGHVSEANPLLVVRRVRGIQRQIHTGHHRERVEAQQYVDPRHDAFLHCDRSQ